MMTAGSQFELSYFKRFRMEIDLNALPEPRPLPPGYSLVSWDAFLADQHAEALIGASVRTRGAPHRPPVTDRWAGRSLLRTACFVGTSPRRL